MELVLQNDDSCSAFIPSNEVTLTTHTVEEKIDQLRSPAARQSTIIVSLAVVALPL